MSQNNKSLLAVLAIFAFSSGVQASANDDKKNVKESFLQIEWYNTHINCQFDVYLDNDFGPNKLVTECVEKCMIKPWLWGGIPGRYLASEGLAPTIFYKNQISAGDEHKSKKDKLLKLSGISYCNEKLVRAYGEPDANDKKYFKEFVFSDLSEKLTGKQKQKLLSLALVNGILDSQDHYALYYLLSLCDPNEDLNFIQAQWFEKDGKDNSKSLKSFLHACAMSPFFLACFGSKGGYVFRVPEHLSHAILTLVKRGANVGAKNEAGEIPLDILNRRVALLKNVLSPKQVIFDDQEVVKALTPAKK